MIQTPDAVVEASAAAAEQSSVSSAEEKKDGKPGDKNPFLDPAPIPVFEGPRGIRFDFNQGARVILPARESGQWHAVLRDLEGSKNPLVLRSSV
ncbi:hypothetical protein [Gluconobacter oxydans]|uniref:Autotransproter heptosyltransferase TibC/BAHTCr-like N-terminal domain-containing protein n=1 Tax=Gluconobacter oxydans TaxID=442 RepID=A0AB35ALH5_GLUOY|nr:hypothetical protein [Gluconobacter oxydans]MBF0855600.1 hypothetical protein [Gluconobacter oxydans]